MRCEAPISTLEAPCGMLVTYTQVTPWGDSWLKNMQSNETFLVFLANMDCAQTHRESCEYIPVDRPLDEAEDRDPVDDAQLREQRELRGDTIHSSNQRFSSNFHSLQS